MPRMSYIKVWLPYIWICPVATSCYENNIREHISCVIHDVKRQESISPGTCPTMLTFPLNQCIHISAVRPAVHTIDFFSQVTTRANGWVKYILQFQTCWNQHVGLLWIFNVSVFSGFELPVSMTFEEAVWHPYVSRRWCTSRPQTVQPKLRCVKP